MALLSLLFGILTLTGGLLAKTSRTSQCRNGWISYEGACYLFIYSEKDTWLEASSRCNILHGYLADILDRNENEFLKNELRRTHASGCFYIGATDVEFEGHWLWQNSDTPAHFFDWGYSEPQNAGGGEDCVCMDSRKNFQWIDVPCHSHRHVLCKTRIEDGGFSSVVG
ncbi:perlucin-like protein isoform X3 [Argopecten irradians]|uniref:perlucin-like protein isoform X3 n=1 Tax=Argopecten irradians TaxID=31199 RepID=UPI00371328B1